MAAKNPWTNFQSIRHDKNNPTKLTDKKPSPNIIVTWKVTILF